MEYREEIEDGIFVGSGFLEDGKKTGIWKYFYDTGELKNEVEYQNGTKHGFFKLYHENGNIAIECTHLNGKTVGIWKEYYENGQMQEVVEYIDNVGTPLDFWDEEGNHILKNGTGKKVIKYGGLFNDIWEQTFENKNFISERKIIGGTFISFASKTSNE